MNVKFYCKACGTFQNVEIEPAQQDDLSHHLADVICAECHSVVAVITANESGKYVFAKAEGEK